ncbi:hypothetical protein CPAR01_09858 [Colletotrichum paranaense]|uniref:Uncharacterized protein n=1 Tax=Colletotrichum paranaense TaxID=1914294 RepID=A0ABQ9SD13_9PEZI|nr:uncharacterized protein CPAR01_09858 [Colletotrichum paranaense]KAK1533150.1 hypothetical protein CPAR01_09858 [Colletotrichum paranaense]
MARGPDDPYPYELLASSRCPPKPRGRTRQGGMGPWSTCLPWELQPPRVPRCVCLSNGANGVAIMYASFCGYSRS